MKISPQSMSWHYYISLEGLCYLRYCLCYVCTIHITLKFAHIQNFDLGLITQKIPHIFTGSHLCFYMTLLEQWFLLSHPPIHSSIIQSSWNVSLVHFHSTLSHRSLLFLQHDCWSLCGFNHQLLSCFCAEGGPCLVSAWVMWCSFQLIHHCIMGCLHFFNLFLPVRYNLTPYS